MSRRKRGRQRPHVPHSTDAAASEVVLPVNTEDQMRLALSDTDQPSALNVEIVRSPAQETVVAPAPAAIEKPRAERRAETASIGAHLRAAREAAGLTLDDAARRVKVPVAAIRGIEAERYEELGPPVYARGYLKSYARLLDVPEVVIEPALERLVEAPVLVATHAVPPARYFASRFSTPLLYAVLTLFVVVPALSFVYQRAQLPPREPKLERLDGTVTSELSIPDSGAATATPSAPLREDGSGASVASAAPRPEAPAPAPVETPSDAQQPVMASIAPMAPAPAPAAPAASPNAQHVALKLAESSWVELVGADGSRIEYAMLPANTTREYQIAGKAMLRIGNIRGARLEVDGKPVDLQPFAHANVARVNLGAGAATPAER